VKEHRGTSPFHLDFRRAFSDSGNLGLKQAFPLIRKIQRYHVIFRQHYEYLNQTSAQRIGSTRV